MNCKKDVLTLWGITGSFTSSISERLINMHRALYYHNYTILVCKSSLKAHSEIFQRYEEGLDYYGEMNYLFQEANILYKYRSSFSHSSCPQMPNLLFHCFSVCSMPHIMLTHRGIAIKTF